MNDCLYLLTSTPTVISAMHATDLVKISKNQNGNTIKVDSKELIIHDGAFENFHVYIIVTHSKFSIIPESIVVNKSGFKAQLKLLSNNSIIDIYFTKPFETLHSVDSNNWENEIYIQAVSFNDDEIYNGFLFADNKNLDKPPLKLFCDLHFISNNAVSITNNKLKLEIEYIGIAEQNGRTANERLAGGHSALQKIVTTRLARTPKKDCSICLYKFKEEDMNKILDFSKSIATIEASLISFFKPQFNTQRKNFPNKANFKKKEGDSLEKTLINKKINHIITFLAPPKNCSLYSNTQNQSNMNEQKQKRLEEQYGITDYIEYCIHQDLTKIK